MHNLRYFFIMILLLLTQPLQADSDNTMLAVWANEAIVATYTYDYKDYIKEQRDIAKYFTAEGWTNYTTALNNSKLPDAVMKNNYYVSAVATYPPEVKQLNDKLWQATMPILVIYKNPQYQQKQTLQVVIQFSRASAPNGVRGFAIESLISKVSVPPCECKPQSN